jgi:hypothetical protein
MQRERHVYPLLTEGLVPAGQLGAVGVELFDPPVRGPARGLAPRAGPIAGDIDVLCAIKRGGAAELRSPKAKLFSQASPPSARSFLIQARSG